MDFEPEQNANCSSGAFAHIYDEGLLKGAVEMRGLFNVLEAADVVNAEVGSLQPGVDLVLDGEGRVEDVIGIERRTQAQDPGFLVAEGKFFLGEVGIRDLRKIKMNTKKIQYFSILYAFKLVEA